VMSVIFSDLIFAGGSQLDSPAPSKKDHER